MESQDFVSVIIPAYNAAPYVARAVDSVLSQTHKHREVIVVNDGSTDNTLEVLKSYGDRITVVHQQNRGLSSARNRGIEASRGPYIGFLDADDYWLPEKLERQMKVFRERPEIGFCSTAARVETQDGTRISEWKCPVIENSVLRTIFVRTAAVAGSGSSVVVRREVQEKVGFFDESLESLEDIDMWMRLAAISAYACVPEPLAVIVRYGSSMSKKLDVMRESAVRVMRKNRHLLDRRSRGRFWQAAYAAILADYAKWEYRCGRKSTAVLHLLEALCRSPIRKGRLSASLMLAMLANRAV